MTLPPDYQSFKEEVRSRNPIEEVIGQYVKLERRGNRYVGLCPFHSEKTPSFHVVPEWGIYHCFGCKASGDVFKFLMEREHLTFPEALAELARRAGLPLPRTERTPEEEAAFRERQAMYEALDLAARFFHDQLYNTPEGREKGLRYLKERGLTDETIRAFQLGWAPGHGKLKNQLSRRFRLELLQKVDLIKPTDRGGYMDTFFERVMFPITDISGRVIGFGGRIVEGEGAKYKNTADTPLFSKRHQLFGLSQAKAAIRAANKAILVEGYLDVITPHQAGIRNVVAPLGTALTPEQCRLLRQQAETVVVAFDADTAGQMATIRGLDLLAETGCEVLVLRLPDGKDPDEFIRVHGPEAFQRQVDAAIPLLEFKLRLALQRHGGKTPEAKAKALEAVAAVLAAEKSEVKREAYIQLVARELAEGGGNPVHYEAAIRRTLDRRLGRSRPVQVSPPEPSRSSPQRVLTALEAEVLQRALQNPALWDVVEAELPDYTFSTPEHCTIVEAVRKLRSEGEKDLPPRLVESISDPASRTLLMEYLTREVPSADAEVELRDYIRGILRQRIAERIEVITRQIASAKAEEKTALMQELMNLKREQLRLGRR